MMVKKYVVESMPDALQKIRIELGKDAVIINTKEIRVGGFMGFFRRKMIEVVAAADSAPSPAAAAAARKPVAAAKEPAAAQSVAVPPLSAVTQPLPHTAPQAAVRPPAALPERPPVRSKAQEDELLAEIKQMKDMMRRMAESTSSPGLDGEEKFSPPFCRLQEHLTERDIRPDVAEHIIGQAVLQAKEDFGGEAVIDEELARQAVKKEIVKLLTKHPVEQLRPGVRIVHFVGPTGVGKTTTIAKIAAELTLKQKKSIGLITSDTYRIAAIEQLRTYASILNVPLEVVFTPMELRKTLDQLEEKDMILMDTAGRNFRNEMAVSELQSLLRMEENRDTFLVLSLSMKYNDMKKVTENFHTFGIHKVLFTKSDETDTLGSIVNLLYDFPLSLSYITNGQNVPDDILVADAEDIAEQVIGEQYDA